jgi:uroporphyrinogen-III synthase
LIARNAAKVFPELRQPDCPTRLVTISPLTTRAALEAGLSVQAEADDSSWDSMLQAIRHQHGGPES